MKINDSNIIDQIVSININRRLLEVNDIRAHSVIVIPVGLLYNEGTLTTPKWTPIKDLNANLGLTIDATTFVVKRNLDLSLIKVANVDETQKLKDFIKYYFLEGGENLHIKEVTKVAKANILNREVIYRIVIQSCPNDEMKVVLSDNGERDLHYVVDESSTINESNKIFRMNTYGNFYYLSHVASYLEKLTLDNIEIRDYNYTPTSSIVPLTKNDIIVGSENTLINIGGKGFSIGGELTTGENLIQSYALRLLEDRLKSTLFIEMTKKPSRSQTTTIFYNTISNVLDKFYETGILDSASFIDPTFSIQYNQKNYIVVENGEFLAKGYKIHIVDVSDTSKEDLESKTMTPITIVILMSKQIRFIKLDMEVF